MSLEPWYLYWVLVLRDLILSYHNGDVYWVLVLKDLILSCHNGDVYWVFAKGI